MLLLLTRVLEAFVNIYSLIMRKVFVKGVDKNTEVLVDPEKQVKEKDEALKNLRNTIYSIKS